MRRDETLHIEGCSLPGDHEGPCDVRDENPSYGPGNPDWERDFERDAA